MNYKNVILIALALCLCFAVAPAAALWNGENWVAEDHNAGCDKVAFDSQTGNTNCYTSVDPAIALKNDINQYGGRVVGNVRAGYPTLSKTISIVNVLAPNDTPMIVDVQPDGNFNIPANGDGVLSPGNYTATLDNFNLPDETVAFNIVAGQMEPTRITFIGQASSGFNAAHTPVYTITKATYGAPFSFYVTSATYGGSWAAKTFTPGKVDVTSIVNALVKGNGLHIAADYNPNQHYNKLFTDPNHGTVKMLTVNYVANGVAGTMSVSEENDFVLDIPQTNYAEVTDYFKAHLVGNTVSTIATGSTNDWAWLNSFGIADPSVGTVKSITVDYTKDGVVGYYTTNPNVNGAGLTTITLP